MSQLFDKIKVGSTKRSTFDLSHNQVTTSDFGYIIPICYRDMVPNDDFVVTPNIFCRLSPLAVPVYGQIKARIHHFFVPYRILYPFWDSFITQDASNQTVPPYYRVYTLRQALNTDEQFSESGSGGASTRGLFGRLMANLGLLPTLFTKDVFAIPADERISAFPFLAYYRIWLDYFMDSNIYDHGQMVAAFNQIIANGGEMTDLNHGTDFLKYRNCCFKKDYFTTAKLHPQDGSPSIVGVDLGTALNPGIGSTSATSNIYVNSTSTKAFKDGLSPDANNIIGQFTIEALRAADALQRYKEKNNFVGTKIINRILAHFGIAPTPERLDMAEFLDGTSFDVQIGDVTSHNSLTSEQGTSSQGLGIQAGKGIISPHRTPQSVRYHAKEHGIFMSVMSIIPDTSYYQGISRMWQKGVTGDALDFFHPEFENLGYQEVLNKEIYVSQDHGNYSDYDSDGIFGYTPRYSEYKFQNDILAGDFVGNIAASQQAQGANLDSWHLFRKLSYSDADPLALNENFVELKNKNTDYDRIFQFTSHDYDHFYFNIHVDVKATRPMDGFTAPSLTNNNAGDGNSINLPYGGTRL